MSKLKLSDKEITALAKKVQDKKNKERAAAITAKAKAKLPEARKYIDQLNALPEKVLQYVYDNRWYRSRIKAEDLAKILLEKDPSDHINDNLTVIEADITLAAHDCTTLTQLCRKLGI